MADRRIAYAAEHPAGFWNRLGYGVVVRTAGSAIRLFCRLRVENPPAIAGPYVVVANHQSFIDPVVLGLAIPRRATFMMTVLHFRSPTLGWFYRLCRAIPIVLRGSGLRDALRAARAVLQRGEVIALFPEGGMSRDGAPLLGNPGAVSLALAEDVPVVPAWIEGARDAMPANTWLPRPRRVTVRFGTPVPRQELVSRPTAGRRQWLEAATAEIMERIAALGGHVSRERWLRERRLLATTP